MSLIFSFALIGLLRKKSIGQNIREDGPSSHFSKAGIPTMGGIAIISSFILTNILLNPSVYTLLMLFPVMSFGLLGFIDDYISVKKGRSLGVKARYKFVLQILFGALFTYLILHYGYGNSEINIPFSDSKIELGWFYLPFATLMIVASSNAVNITDGLDGLAGGSAAIVSLAYLIIAIQSGQQLLGITCAALCGACLGFLYFNRHPAKIFMGDTGSLALGASLASIAILAKAELLLIIIGGLFLWETLSVVLQVASFKLRGKRIFKMSPYHHHLELLGWGEVEIGRWFWAGSLILALIGMLALRPIL